jgi:hypothetical protein
VAAPPYEKSVFINCPFDAAFEPLFHAIVLTTAARGFTPRCARESEGQADPRIDRIAKGLLESKYSIHDLSRFQGEGPENLARFNMPLELGMAVGIRYGKEGQPQTHNWVALVPPGFVHQKFISDLAGFDVPDHDSTPLTVIKQVAWWLSLQPDFILPTPTATSIFAAYQGFSDLLEQSRSNELGVLTWSAVLKNAELVVSQLPAG